MNKEDIINPLELDALCEHLLQENKQLKERIDKAIERLKKIQDNAIKYGANHDAYICYELLEILKGDSNENNNK